MKKDASIGKVNEPVGLVESKSSQEVPWGAAPKSCISKASTAEVEESCGKYRGCWGSLHRFVLWWGWLQSILFSHPPQKKKNLSFKRTFFSVNYIIVFYLLWNIQFSSEEHNSDLYFKENNCIGIGKSYVTKCLKS